MHGKWESFFVAQMPPTLTRESLVSPFTTHLLQSLSHPACPLGRSTIHLRILGRWVYQHETDESAHYTPRDRIPSNTPLWKRNELYFEGIHLVKYSFLISSTYCTQFLHQLFFSPCLCLIKLAGNRFSWGFIFRRFAQWDQPGVLNMDVSRKWWVFPPNHPLKDRVFHDKPSIWGYPYFWKHPNTYISSCCIFQISVVKPWRPFQNSHVMVVWKSC